MSRIAYVNGRYLPHGQAAVHIEDRGYQFADGVYEVCEVLGGRLVDERRHMQRLERSLGEIAIRSPMSRAALGVVLREVLRRNRVVDGMLYLQVTRGVAPRNHAFPRPAVAPSVVVTAHALSGAARERAATEGIAVITLPDNRWERVDIKTVGLLPNVLAKEKAHAAGAGEAWFVDGDGYVTEGSSTNAWIVTEKGRLVTRSAEQGILRGITRSVLFDLVSREKLLIDERPFTVAEALAANEAFLTSTTQLVMPIVRIDGKAVAGGTPGPTTRKLRALFHSQAEVAPFWAVHDAVKADGGEIPGDVRENSRQTGGGRPPKNATVVPTKPKKREV
jgi:D-alanine transaminase